MIQGYTRTQMVKDGIEWISCVPHQPKHDTPILMQHGMWHGAWCWQNWQETLADLGWESHAISLPGHAESPMQRPIRLCTLGYYLQFVRAAVESLPRKPILMGHSMGGALTQWYLRDVGNLPAAILVAPWALYKGFWTCLPAFFKLDTPGCIRSYVVGRSEWARNPYRAGRALLNERSTMTPDELFAKLNPESLLVVQQHALPWGAIPGLTTPMLWLGAEKDTLIPEAASRRAASIYPTAEYWRIDGAAHNIMMEHNHRDIALRVNGWLSAKIRA